MCPYDEPSESEPWVEENPFDWPEYEDDWDSDNWEAYFALPDDTEELDTYDDMF